LNKIYIKYKEYDTYKEAIEEIKETLEINGFCFSYRRPANDQHDQHEYVCVKRMSGYNEVNFGNRIRKMLHNRKMAKKMT